MENKQIYSDIPIKFSALQVAAGVWKGGCKRYEK